jgi:hypothetical protein
MTRTRIALTTFAAFFVSQVMAVLIHGFVLAADYEPFDGTLCDRERTRGSSSSFPSRISRSSAG